MQHPLLLLIHPAQRPAVLAAQRLQAALLFVSVPLVRHQSLHVPPPLDLAVDLRLLVLHLPNLGGVAEDGGLRGLRDLDGLLQLLCAVLVQHVCVVVEHGQPIGLQVRGVLRRESAAKSAVPQHQVRVAVLHTLHDTSVVVHGIQHAVLTPMESGRLVVAASEQVPLPALPNLRLQQTTRACCFELVPVVRIALHERHHLRKVAVHDNGCKLSDVRQRHPEVVVGVTHFLHLPLQLRQILVVVVLRQLPDMSDGRLLARHEL
mmetsp:Transcript_29662/g.85054  ORF Transcript_29662/g.85054 Transcript_29662/m.85054 type:complete len:262 (-) Transcript_29662:109-894(-)